MSQKSGSCCQSSHHSQPAPSSHSHRSSDHSKPAWPPSYHSSKQSSHSGMSSTSAPSSHHAQSHISSSTLRSGPPIKLCECKERWVSGDKPTREDAIHTAKHLVGWIPDDSEDETNKLTLIRHCLKMGVEPSTIGTTHWGVLAPDPDTWRNAAAGLPNMTRWTVGEQMDYWCEKLPQKNSEGYDIHTYARIFKTMGCWNCRHHLKLDLFSQGNFEGAVDGCIACHNRRTGHQYRSGCCGGGAYLDDSPQGYLTFESNGSARSGSQARAKSWYTMGGYVPESRRSRSSKRSGKTGSSHRSRASRYDRSQASGWLPPKARSEQGVPASTVLGRSVKSEGNTSTILPGESQYGYNQRQDERRAKGQARGDWGHALSKDLRGK